MKKIVIDARESGSSSGRYLDKLVEYLAKLKPKYQIVLLAKPGRVEFLRGIAPKFEIIESPHKEFSFAEQFNLYKQITNINPDLVHFTFAQQPILYRGKVVTTIHDLTTAKFRNPAKNWLVFTFKQLVYKWVIKIAARKSLSVITPSEYVKDDVAKFAHINSRKVMVTYEAADQITEVAELVEGVNDDTQFIMYVGRPQPHKNLDRLIDAFIMLKVKHPNLKLVLAGKKDVLYKRLSRSTRGAGFDDVIFTGFVSEGQLRRLYEHCAAYVFPSLSEGFGLPGLEAMAHGAPVVSSNATCLPEIYGDAAEYFDPLEPFSIASAIARVLDNPKLADSLRQKGHKQAAKYSWTKMAEETLGIYDSHLS
jgi:glycosyltransferase involved in cell wall biosynthesis